MQNSNRGKRTSLAAFFSIFSLGLVAIRPLFASGHQLACSDDVSFHILRLAQYDHLFRQGVFFSRWAPDMAQGYGYPLFNFYAPLSYYFAEFFSLLVGGDLNLGLRLTFAFGVIAGGFTLYLLARDHFSPTAAVVGAAAYMYAPYQGLDIYHRGNLAESFAWWLMPLSLWCMGRLVRSADWRWVPPTALTFAAVILSHNAFALLFSPLLALYGLWLIITQQKEQNRWGQLVPIISSLILGLALAMFFWLPALVEREFVHTERLLVPPTFVYWGNFLTLWELLASPRTIRPDLINPSIPRSLGWPQVMLGLIATAVLGLSRFTRQQKSVTFFFLGGSLFTIFLMLEPSFLIWDTVPLLEFVQFPWRFLGIVALTLAMLCAAGTDVLLGSRQTIPVNQATPTKNRTWVALLIIPIIVLSVLYWFDPRYCPGNAEPTVADILDNETSTKTIGTTAKGEYIPLTSARFPAEPYQRPFTAPEGVELSDIDRQPLSFSAVSRSDTPYELTVNAFYFPGWQGTLNGEDAPLLPSDEVGLITLNVPAGEQRVDVQFRETPLRKGANVVSILTLIGLIGIMMIAPKRNRTDRMIEPLTSNSLISPYGPIAILGLGLFLLAGWGLPRSKSFLFRPEYPEPFTPQAQFQGGISLANYQIEKRAMSTHKTIDLWVDLKSTAGTKSDYLTAVRLIGPTGKNWLLVDALHPRTFNDYYESRLWRPDQFARDLLIVDPIPGTPPGTYTLELIVFDKYSLQADPTTTGALSFNLGTIELHRPLIASEPVEPQYEIDVGFHELRLIGYGLDRVEARSGDPFTVTQFWRAETDPTENLSSQWNLILDGETAFSIELEPSRHDWETTEWRKGDVWRGQHSFSLPAGLESGEYKWELCVKSICHETGSLSVSAPDREVNRPEMGIELSTDDAILGDFGRLAGANLDPNNLSEVTLFWHPAAEARISYQVFVHLLRADGTLVAQSDGEPAQWSRPTTSWVADEYIRDTHILGMTDPLPSGDYRLITGLYEVGSGYRLRTADGQDYLLISEFVVP